MFTKNTDSNKLKKIGSDSKNTSKARNKSRISRLIKSHCKSKLSPNGLQKWPKNQFQSQVRVEPLKRMNTNTQKGSLILTQKEDVKHRVSHNMIKICYGLKGLYQVVGEENF